MFRLFVIVGAFAVGSVNSWVNFADVSCGVNFSRGARVVGGGAARRAEFPWLASLTRRGGHYCGATVLSKRWLITAGHCMCSGTDDLLQPGYIKATLGEYDLTQPEVPKAQEVRIERIIPHPQHRCGRAAFDIALVRLSSDITWSDAIAPACMPDGPRGNTYTDYSGAPATVAGWGWLNEDNSKGGRADILQKVEVNVLENTICQQWYASQGKKTKINPNQMCAGDEQGGKDSCWADSGGPLMSFQGSNSVVIGVVSTGIGCGRPRLPGLYTRISEYMEWIQQEIRN